MMTMKTMRTVIRYMLSSDSHYDDDNDDDNDDDDDDDTCCKEYRSWVESMHPYCY